MAKKVEITVTISEVKQEVKDRYGNIEQYAGRDKLIGVDLSADSVEEAQIKVAALLEIYK
ncbi:hypothetical protein [Cellulosimicrobium phage DS1]|nr:hypothetical protein [Cellulosimicrobium phage DS1]